MSSSPLSAGWCDLSHPEWYEFHPDYFTLPKEEPDMKDKCKDGKIHLLVPHPDVDGIPYGQCVRCGYLAKTGHEPQEPAHKSYAVRTDTCCTSGHDFLQITETELAAYEHLATKLKERNIHLEFRPILAGLTGVVHGDGIVHCDECGEDIETGEHKFFKPLPSTGHSDYLCLWCATTVPSPAEATQWLADQGTAHNIDAYNHYLHIREGQALVCKCDYEGQQ